MRIDIYIDADAKGTQIREHGRAWYIMETEFKGKPLIRKKSLIFMEHNRNGALLECICYSLKQIRASKVEILIHTDCPYISGRMTRSQIDAWETGGYITKDGLDIRYRNLWEQIGLIVVTQDLQIHSGEISEDKKQELLNYGKSLQI